MGKLFFNLFLILTFMAKIIIPEIRDKYNHYNTLLRDRKSIFEEVISISEPKENQKHFLTTENIKIKHQTLPDNIFLIAEVRIDNYKYFNFKLRCKTLSDVPFFRFDSDGEAHRNYDENIPLADQQITTPHFHCYNQNGLLIAYKTPQLLREEDRKALEDITLCIAHFCSESNIRLNNEYFPTINILPGTLEFKNIEDDPNKGVQFI